MEFAFDTLKFKEDDDDIVCHFLSLFSFRIAKKELEKLGRFEVKDSKIIFEEDSPRIERKFNNLINKGFDRLKNKIGNKRTIYIHKNSGIPLIGNVAFGIVDRNTSCIEVKPITGCNLRCVYCSVSDDNRPVDFVIGADYLADEVRKLAEFKDSPIEAHINAQGEPMLYADMVELVKRLNSIPQVNVISMDTNATLLDEKLVDKLIKAGMTRFNVSLDAIDEDSANKMTGTAYNLKKVIKMIRYIAERANLIIAPVWVPKYNDDQIEKLIEFTKTLKNDKFEPRVGIQNFLNYKTGRNPVKQKAWENFYDDLEILEKKHNIKLILSEDDFKITHTKPTPKPFNMGEVVQAEIIGRGRLKDERLAVAKNRLISVFNTDKMGAVKLRIIKTKHNMFTGEIV